MSHEAIIQRLVYPIINEAARCLDEKVVESADDVDLAMVFGTGFAPFRGGPLRYADTVGIAKIVETLDRLSSESPRFAPCEALRRRAASGERFHPAESWALDRILHPGAAGGRLTLKIAINGAGIAGPALAYWLDRSGHEPTLIEKAPNFARAAT